MITTISLEGNKYTLINYKEIITYYKQPFYKKWFSNPPVKELLKVTKSIETNDHHKHKPFETLLSVSH